MPRNPKFHEHGSVLLITTSTEEGLMFPPNPLIKTLVLSALLNAQRHHPGLTLCHFFLNSTHIHIIAYVDTPTDVKGFMERFKTESSHYINRLLGRARRTVWCERYDSPTLLTEDDACHWIAYIYKNASKDGLVESVSEYPGLSTWQLLNGEKDTIRGVELSRGSFEALPNKRLTHSDYLELSKALLEGRGEKAVLTINRDKWMEAYGVEERSRELNERIVRDVLHFEEELREKRKRKGEGVIGVRALKSTRIGAPYTPERSGKRMLCLSLDRKLRESFIEATKELFSRAKEVYEKWLSGDHRAKYPIGLYAPSFPRLAERWGEKRVGAHW